MDIFRLDIPTHMETERLLLRSYIAGDVHWYYLMKDLEKNWDIQEHRAFLLEIFGKIESETSLIGASPHIMCVGEKKGNA